MIVMKFGGSSVESASAIERIAGIVRQRLDRQPAVVVSAMGKTTNRLLAAAQLAAANDRVGALHSLDELRAYHQREAEQLVASPDRPELEELLHDHFRELQELVRGLAVLGELTPRSLDAVASYGERLSSAIVTLAFRALGLPAVHVDARRVVVTDGRHTQAAPLYEQTNTALQQSLRPILEAGEVAVMGGFVGATVDGVTTTLGRGGSDFSASIVGAGIGAEEVQIWTDVDGMLTADPTILPGGHRVKSISFAEAAELAYFGAKVLHPSTVLPAVEKSIPILILNSRRPDVPGTQIIADAVPCRNVVKSIACKRRIMLVNVHSTRMLMAHGFLHRIFETFARFGTSVDMVATSEVSVSLTIDDARQLDSIVQTLQEFAEVTVEPDHSIVCLVGDNIRHTPGIAGRIFHAIPDVTVRMISQGASLLNVSFVVAERDLQRTVAQLHEEFFRELDPEVFD